MVFEDEVWKKEESMSKPVNNSEKVGDEQLQFSESFQKYNKNTDTKKSLLLQWKFLILGLFLGKKPCFLFHCMANKLKMQEWLQQNWKYASLQGTAFRHFKGADYFKQILESQNWSFHLKKSH